MAKNRNAPDDLQALRSHLADVEKRLAESIRKEMAPRREVAYDQMAVRSARAKLAAALALKRRELLSKRRDLNKLIGDLQTKEEDLLCPRPGGDMAATRPERQLALAALRPVLRRLLDLGPEELGAISEAEVLELRRKFNLDPAPPKPPPPWQVPEPDYHALVGGKT